MRVGLQIPAFNWPGSPANIGPKLIEIARTAEDAGFASIWVMDHFFQIHMVGPAEDPMLEAYTTLGYIAAVTRKVQLGVMVTGVIYRNPGVLVKTVSTLDVLSGGRAYLGIGAAWYEREAKGLGVDYPSTKERFERLEETLQIAHQMWSGEVGTYNGKHYQLTETLNQPQPLSKPHPPILIGGMGEQKTLRLVAQYADACNLFAGAGSDVLRSKLEILQRHCAEVGRPFAEIELTAIDRLALGPNGKTVEQVIADFRALAELGFQHVIISFPNTYELTPLELFGREVIPAIADF